MPQQVETFLVHLPCSGNVTEQVPLSVNMLVKGPPRHNATHLHFKRNKICIKGNLSVFSFRFYLKSFYISKAFIMMMTMMLTQKM